VKNQQGLPDQQPDFAAAAAAACGCFLITSGF
jgi:hypothetical protein